MVKVAITRQVKKYAPSCTSWRRSIIDHTRCNGWVTQALYKWSTWFKCHSRSALMRIPWNVMWNRCPCAISYWNVLGNLPAECFIIDEATTIASSGRARYMCFAQWFPSQVITDNIQALPNQENLVSERTTIKKPKMSVSVMSGHKDVLLATKRDMREVSEHQSHVLHFVLLYKDEVILPNDSPRLPSTLTRVLPKFAKVFPFKTPSGVPPLRGIEHRIDLIPSVPLPNRSPYRINLE